MNSHEEPSAHLIAKLFTLTLTRNKGKSTFQNVSKYLLYIYAFLDGVNKRISLFDDRLVDYYWQYDNNGLRLAQLRFYECATIVPDANSPGGAQLDLDCFSGSH